MLFRVTWLKEVHNMLLNSVLYPNIVDYSTNFAHYLRYSFSIKEIWNLEELLKNLNSSCRITSWRKYSYVISIFLSTFIILDLFICCSVSRISSFFAMSELLKIGEVTNSLSIAVESFMRFLSLALMCWRCARRSKIISKSSFCAVVALGSSCCSLGCFLKPAFLKQLVIVSWVTTFSQTDFAQRRHSNILSVKSSFLFSSIALMSFDSRRLWQKTFRFFLWYPRYMAAVDW